VYRFQVKKTEITNGGQIMEQTRFHRTMLLVLIILGMILLAVLALTKHSAIAANPVQAAALPQYTSTSDEPVGGPFTCTIGNIATFSNRIHVFCSNAVPPLPQYFAAWGDSAHALATNRFLTLLNTAYALGKPVHIYYFDDPGQNPTGCNTNDCRGIDWIYIVP
jgi:hypothetical protein